MASYDILMLVVLVTATLFGFLKGFAWQVASLASIFASYVVAVQFRGPVADLIGTERTEWNSFLAMLILYVGTSILIWLGFRLISKSINDLKLKGFDRQIGGIFGAAKGVVLCTVITLFAVALLSDVQRAAVIHSRSGYYIAKLLDRAEPMIPAELHRRIEPYIHGLENSLERPAFDARNYGPAQVQGQAETSPMSPRQASQQPDAWPVRSEYR
jgi:membrane protein required for colicin V production